MKRSCPECETEMRPVKLLDATAHDHLVKTGACHIELSYAAPDSKPSFWKKSIASEGVIRGMLCPECGRTLFYAQPNE